MRRVHSFAFLLCVSALPFCLTGCGGQSKAAAMAEMQDKYDRIQVGMSAEEFDMILHGEVKPPRGSGSTLEMFEDEHGHRITVVISNGKVETKVQQGFDE